MYIDLIVEGGKEEEFFLVFTKGKKEKSVSFYWTYVCVRANLTFVSIFYEPFPYSITCKQEAIFFRMHCT